MSRKHILKGFLTNLGFMGGCGCLLIFCMLKRHVETKKPSCIETQAVSCKFGTLLPQTTED